MLDELNTRLKAAKLGVRIECRGNRLYLVATLPPKPNSAKQYKHQQRVSTGLYANDEGLKEVYGQAVKLSADIARNTFRWDEPEEKSRIPNIAEAVQTFTDWWRSRYGDDIKRETTWQKDYLAVFRRLPQDALLQPDFLRDWIIDNSQPNSRTRKKFCSSLGSLARHCGVEVELSDLRGNYSATKVGLRNLPSDQEIHDLFFTIENPKWRWLFGMMATFGLRNHEVFFVDTEYLSTAGICYVKEGKSYDGKVWPFYPEWLEAFDLRNPQIPAVTGKLHIDYGQRVNGFFYKHKLPFPPYALRHCWARRVISLGLDSRLAAKQMRHSHAVHCTTYNKWLDDSVHQAAFEKIINGRDLV